MSELKLKVANLPSQKLAYSNRVYCNANTFDHLVSLQRTQVSVSDPCIHVQFSTPHSFEGVVFLLSKYTKPSDLNDFEVGMNAIQRKFLNVALQEALTTRIYAPSSAISASEIQMSVDLLKKNSAAKVKLDGGDLNEQFLSTFKEQVFQVHQQFVMDFDGQKLDLVVTGIKHADVGNSGNASDGDRGFVVPSITCGVFKKRPGATATITITGGSASNANSGGNENLFRSEFDFEKMGIGGLGAEFQKIFRRAFASRMYPTHLVKQMGFAHVKGILLYGPPGCGKTLIARKIGQALNSREPKIVNGPEILNQYVGGSEEKVRELFVDAEQEEKEEGDDSMLHIIIFDELDAIMKKRGSTGDSTGVHDSVVNQLLSKMDGVDSLNNILIIGMTNRKDMIDEAILRPGRLEVHVEIGLPDTNGRDQILRIHTAEMVKHNRLSEAAFKHIPTIVEETKNFTGAEIAGLVRSAASFALAKTIDAKNLSATDFNSVMVEAEDFDKALSEVIPAFGAKDNSELESFYRNGIINYGTAFTDLYTSLVRMVKQVKESSKTPLLSVLLEGASATGKSALAAKLCVESDFPLVRLITPDSMIGMHESQKCQHLFRTFSDAYRSPLSVIFIDDIERIIEYTPVGCRFSNSVLQTLLILLRKPPPVEGRRLFIIATTSISHLLEDLQLNEAFNVVLHVSCLQTPDEYRAVLSSVENCSLTKDDVKQLSDSISKPIGIKQLLLVLEMARSNGEEDGEDSGKVSPMAFMECLLTCGF